MIMAENKPIEALSRAEVSAAIAEYAGVPREDVEHAFSSGQTEHLRSVLMTGTSGQAIEKQILLTGAGFTILGGVMLEPGALCVAFGVAATIGLYGAQRFSRWRMDSALRHAVNVLEHGRPRQG